MRRSLGLPITMAVVMIVLVVLLIVGWTFSTIWAASAEPRATSVFWTLLPIGAVFLTVILAGVIVYLVLSVKLINLNQRQSNFIDAVTHELKSPLASLKLQLQTLERLKVTDQQRADFYKNMNSDINRLETLINQVLMVSVLESKVSKYGEDTTVYLRKAVENSVRIACTRHGVEQQSVSIQLPDLSIIHKRFVVELILQNLIDNAVKYSCQESPQVKISARKSANGWILIRIADNGLGIPPEMRKKIFLRFYRVGNELERKNTGTGLGLYIVKMLIRQARGRLRIKDRFGKSGTNFDLVLPGRLFDNAENKLDAEKEFNAEKELNEERNEL